MNIVSIVEQQQLIRDEDLRVIQELEQLPYFKNEVSHGSRTMLLAMCVSYGIIKGKRLERAKSHRKEAIQ